MRAYPIMLTMGLPPLTNRTAQATIGGHKKDLRWCLGSIRLNVEGLDSIWLGGVVGFGKRLRARFVKTECFSICDYSVSIVMGIISKDN